MSGNLYNARNSRVKKAKLYRKYNNWLRASGWLLIGFLIIVSAYLAATGSDVAPALAGLGLWLVIIQLWLIGDVSNLKPQKSPADPGARLDQLLEPKLLALIKWPSTQAEVWNAASRCWEGVFVLNRLGVHVDIAAQILDMNPGVDVWSPAIHLAADGRMDQLDAGTVVASILLSEPFKPVLDQMKLDREDVISVLQWQRRLAQEMKELNRKPAFGGIGRDWANGYTPTLNRFAKNITHEVEYGYYRHLPQIHEGVVDRMIGQLTSTNPHVALVGDVGSGKTALVYSMAERLIKGEEAGGLDYFYVMELNAAVILSEGNVEETVLRLMAEAVHARNVIIFLDDAQLFFGHGTGAVDLSKVLLPILQQSPLKVVMAMTNRDWQLLSGSNPGLATLIQKLAVNQPAQTDSIKVMEDAAIGIEAKTKTTVTYQAIKEGYRLAERYMTESAFPGKGITLLEAATNYAESSLVTARSVQAAVEATVGTKVTTADSTESAQLLNLEDEIHKRMVNQTHAVKVVSDALRRARAGVRNPKRPVGSFLFLGPTGVGKTELAKALADIYFGGEDKIVRIDMSEYQQPGDTQRLLAPTGGQAGNSLISDIRKQPFSVVLFDEIEKANPDILNLFLQLLDEGRLTDTEGRATSFKDAIIIATSNASADLIRDKVAAGQDLSKFEPEIEESLITNHQFKPELINRFDDVVLFRPLNKLELRQVVDLLVAEVNKTLETQKVKVGLSDEAAQRLVDKGYDPKFGARPMRRMVQRSVENFVAKKILEGGVKPGQILSMELADIENLD